MSFKIQTRPNPTFESMDDFSLNKVLGTGAFAVVYEATHLSSGDKYAIKRIDFSKISALDRENVEKELEVHLNLEHEFVVRMVDFLLEADVLYMVLELCTNGNLYRYMNRRRLRLYDIKKIFRQTCLAIQYLHDMNIVMRDLKPENIILDSQNNIKMCDFGWAAKEEDTEYCKIKAGTYAYMSPESLQEKLQNKSSDIWSLGVFLYELYYNKEPFPGESTEQMLELINKGKIDFDQEIDPEGKEMILNLLKINPSDRPTIQQVLAHKFFKSLLEMGFVDPVLPAKKIIIKLESLPEQKIEGGESQTQKTANTSANDALPPSLEEVNGVKDGKTDSKHKTEGRAEKNKVTNKGDEVQFRRSTRAKDESQYENKSDFKTLPKPESIHKPEIQNLVFRTARVEHTPQKFHTPDLHVQKKPGSQNSIDQRRPSTPSNIYAVNFINQTNAQPSPQHRPVSRTQVENTHRFVLDSNPSPQHRTVSQMQSESTTKPATSTPQVLQPRPSGNTPQENLLYFGYRNDHHKYYSNNCSSKGNGPKSPTSIYLSTKFVDQFKSENRSSVPTVYGQPPISVGMSQTTQGFYVNKGHSSSQTQLVGNTKRYEIGPNKDDKPILVRERSVQPSHDYRDDKKPPLAASHQTTLRQNLMFLNSNSQQPVMTTRPFEHTQGNFSMPIKGPLTTENKPALEHSMLEKPRILLEPKERTVKLLNNNTGNPQNLDSSSALGPVFSDINRSVYDKSPSRKRVVYKLDRNNQYSKSSQFFDPLAK
jgi:serine/threonine protein kinase